MGNMNENDELKNKYRLYLENKILWKRFDQEIPKDGQEIWVLLWHQKGHFPSSFQICAGEVEIAESGKWRVNTCDYDGGGSHCFYPNQYDEGFLFWCDKWQISIPEEHISWDWDSGIS